MAGLMETGVSELGSRVELSISCTYVCRLWELLALGAIRTKLPSNLADMDTFSKSDPMVVLFQPDAQGSWKETHRTEIIKFVSSRER